MNPNKVRAVKGNESEPVAGFAIRPNRVKNTAREEVLDKKIYFLYKKINFHTMK
jgi:hypothetical protein